MFILLSNLVVTTSTSTTITTTTKTQIKLVVSFSFKKNKDMIVKVDCHFDIKMIKSFYYHSDNTLNIFISELQ